FAYARRIRGTRTLFAQAVHDLGVGEQVVKSVRVPRIRRAYAKPVRVEVKLFPGRGVMSHGERLAGAANAACASVPQCALSERGMDRVSGVSVSACLQRRGQLIGVGS